MTELNIHAEKAKLYEEILKKYEHPNSPPDPGSQEDVLFKEALAHKRVSQLSSDNATFVEMLSVSHVRSQEEVDEAILKKYPRDGRTAPPKPGSLDEILWTSAIERQRAYQGKLGRHTTEKDLEEVLGSTSIDAGERARMGLQISAQLRKNKRAKAFKFWLGWVVFFMLLGSLIGGGYYYAMLNMEGGRYKVPFSCKFSFGDSELEGRRHLSLPYKSLSGWQWTPPWANIDEEVEVVLKGDPLVIVGVDDKGKTWRKEYKKGEFGVAKLPKSSSYWFIGNNFKETTVVKHSDFCK